MVSPQARREQVAFACERVLGLDTLLALVAQCSRGSRSASFEARFLAMTVFEGRSMRSAFSLLILVALTGIWPSLHAQSVELVDANPLLRVETGRHSAPVRRLSVS